MARQTRKAFSPEFKREAVRLLEREDKPSAQLARELGVRRNQLYKWQKEILRMARLPSLGRVIGLGQRQLITHRPSRPN